MEKTYRKMRVLPGRFGGRPRGYACLKCGHEEKTKESMSAHMKGCYKDA